MTESVDRQFDRAEILGRLRVVGQGELTRYERELEAQLSQVERVIRDMISRDYPESEGLTKLEDIATALDAYDKRTGWTEETQMQDDLRHWSKILAALHQDDTDA